jgi:4-aminobutyrate aminotransferase-like enzyme
MDNKRTTNIIHRTPWQPPIASSAKGIKIYVDDGRELIDGAGGAAVAAVGMGQPKIVKAIQDQVAKMACAYPLSSR